MAQKPANTTKTLNDIYEALYDTNTTASMSGVISAIQTMDNNVTSAIQTMDNNVTSAVKTMDNNVTSAVKTMDNNVTSAVKTMDNNVTSAVKTMDNNVTSAVKTMDNNVTSAIKTMDNNVTSAVKTMDNNVTSAIKTMDNNVTSAIQTMAIAMRGITGVPIDIKGVYTNLLGHFTAAYQSAASIRCSGVLFLPTANQVIKINRWTVSGGAATPESISLAGVVISSGAGYFDITISGYTLNATDLFDVYIANNERAYDAGMDAINAKVVNSNPCIPSVQIASGTNIAAATNYYPVAQGMQITRMSKLRMWDFCSGGVTNSIEIYPSSSFTTPISILGVNKTDGSASTTWVDSAGKAIDYDNLDQCYFRIKSVTSDNSNTINIYIDISYKTLI